MFDNHFQVFLADTPESKKIHYSIRYQVYCEEMGFENKHDFPFEQEFDDHDHQSAHFIVKHKRTGQWIGAMRLIFPIDQSLPLQRHCSLYETVPTSRSSQSVELSRLCVVKELRRRFSDIDPPHGINEDSSLVRETDKVKLLQNDHRSSRNIVFGLLQAASEYCHHNDIKNWYFLTTRPLAKVLRKGGLNLMNIGDRCYHRGERYPYKMDVVETYFSENWGDDYKNGYSLFSECDQVQKSNSIAA
ncbi:MAG: PEP-CTERM/exosortase system-associated acyltransferase [Methylococcaceae bacterium]